MSVSSTSSTSGTTDVTSSNSAPLVVNGLVSGIDTSEVIQALLESYQQPITDLQNQQTSLQSEASDYQTLNTDMQAVLTAAQALNTSSAWNLMSATSSDDSVATASSSPGAQPGTLGFTVNQLAQGDLLVSSGGVSSEGTVVTNASSLLVAVGGADLGFSALGASGGLSVGSHSIDVTQSSAAATVTSPTALPAGTSVVTGSNDTLDLSVNGTAYTLTIPPSSGNTSGTDTPSQLAAAINSAASTAGAPVTASVNSSGELELSTTEQGSAASLSVTGGDALSTLGLTSGQSGTGVDAVVSVDGTSTTLSAIDPGSQVTLNAPTGSIEATIASSPNGTGALVAVGTASAADVSTGNGSLSDLVSNINDSGLAATASAVQTSSGAYVLQLSADNTGLSGSVSIDGSALSGGALGTIQTAVQAQDATVTVGGTSGYSLESATDTFSNLMNGTAITVGQTGQATITVSADAAGEATQVATLVSAANQALSDIQTYAGYDATTKTGGPLMGAAVVENLQQEIESIFAGATGTSNLGDALNVGITLNSNGSLSFDQSTFESAYSANPTEVANLFTQGGTFSPSSTGYGGQVSLVYAGNQTAAGSYDVSITQSATQATDTGNALASGTVSSAETLTVQQGSGSASYSVNAGESLANVAAGLNSAFAANGLTLSAQVVNDGSQLQVTSDGYGSDQTFQVTSTSSGAGTTGLGGATAGTAASFAGTDVAGTIDGQAATGTGQVLAAAGSDTELDGLSLLVTTPGITSATDLGSFDFSPGIAQQLASVADAASNASTGSLTEAVQSLNTEATGLNSQIDNYQNIESQQQTLLQNEFATMESTLGTLKDESSQLSSEISGLS